MGSDSNFWGRYLWVFLHTIASTYPDRPNITDIKNMENFLMSLGEVIPCSICKVHFIKSYSIMILLRINK